MRQAPPDKWGIGRVILPAASDDGIGTGANSNSNSVDISIAGEIFRKLIHLGAIAIPIGYYFLGIRLTIASLVLALFVSLTLDYIRLYGDRRSRRFIYKYLGIMIRPSERRDFVGATYILSGSILTILVFDKMIAIAAISFIVVGDTAGAIIGRLWGRVKFRSKSLEGSLSFFVTSCLAALLIPAIPFWIKIVGAVTAAAVEAITLHIDDNLIVPVTAAALMQVLVNQVVIMRYFT